MKIEATSTKNSNYILNVSNTLFLYVDENKESILREVFEKEYLYSKNTWMQHSYTEEIDVQDLSEDIEKYITDRYDAYKLKISKFREELEEIKFFESSFYDIVMRREASFSRHEYSHGIASDPISLSDTEIHNLFKRFLNKESYIEETLSNIIWIESGSCEGDELFPVIMKATLLGSGKYIIEIDYREFHTERKYETDIYLYSVS
ncbi:MAG: hypothetical protein LBE34_13740 [Flavobacteriaceae bacterium]|jgi:hypothetical protein|nr:hypothetical protein [Flavobacteriaceae bacterium]